MIRDVLSFLACPICRSKMTLDAEGKVCRCLGIRSHCYDVARSGHLYLGGPHAGEGDTKEAILARRAFLDAGYYQSLSDAINDVIDGIGAQTLLDAGCGEGYYTNRLATVRTVLGLDLSRVGIEYAAKRAKQLQTLAGFTVASIFDLPVSDISLDAVVNIFAPCAEREFARVLKPGGHLLVVGAGEKHLMGLKKVLYENPYENPGRADLPTGMKLVKQSKVQTEITVNGNDMIKALFSMTPYYWRTSKEDKEKLANLETLVTELDFDLFLYQK